MKPQNRYPLWLPEGSVRAVLALAIVAALIAGEVAVEVGLAVIAFYFGSRAAEPARPPVNEGSRRALGDQMAPGYSAPDADGIGH